MANISYQKITSLGEVDFDTLFLASFDLFDRSFPLPTSFTYEQKKQLYLDQLQSAFDGSWSVKNTDDTFLIYKGLVDGSECALTGGYVQSDGAFRVHWMLTAPSGNNRNWLYSSEHRAALKAIFAQESVVYYMACTFVGSDIYNIIQSRKAAKFFTVAEEGPIVINGITRTGIDGRTPVYLKMLLA